MILTDKGEGVVLEVSLELGEGPVGSLVNGLFRASKVEGLDTSGGLEGGRRVSVRL